MKIELLLNLRTIFKFKNICDFQKFCWLKNEEQAHVFKIKESI